MTSTESTRILAVHPTSRGFGFAVMEGERLLIDWGTKDARKGKGTQCLALVGDLIEQYGPDVLVLQDVRDREFRRCLRIRDLVMDLRQLGRGRGLQVRAFPRRLIRGVLWSARAITKYQIACAIAERLPELTPRLPPKRKPWMSQDERMAIFDAVALGLVFYRTEEVRSSEAAA